MKKYGVFLFLLTAALLLTVSVWHSSAQGEPLAPDGEPQEIYYAPFPLAIDLDGDLSDWVDVPKITIPLDADLTSDQPAITFAAAADDQYLYFMGDVIDNNIISGQHDQNYWNEDSAEFYINATGDLELTAYTDGVAQITVPAMNVDLAPAETFVAGVQGDTAHAIVRAKRTDTGYAIEIAVPLDNGEIWNIKPAHGTVIGFQVHLNGASIADRDTKLIWSLYDTNDQSYINPSLFGKLIFFEIGRTDVPVPAVPTAEPTPTPAPAVPADAPYKNPELPIEERVNDLLSHMTLDEKLGQLALVEKNSINAADISGSYIGGLLSGGGGYPVPNTPENWAQMVDDFQNEALQTRLAIPIIYGADAIHGHNNVYGATIFPHEVGMGAANDPALLEQICHATAQEMIATGIYWNYSPVVAVPQDIRWGRAYEAYGENTELVSALAVACVRGMQGENLGDLGTVLATPKHFLGDGGTVWGTSTFGGYMLDQGDMQVDEATLRARYLPPYQAAVDAGAMSIMPSFSSWNGTKMHAEKYLITDVLEGELGFQGFIVSDWQAIDQLPGDYYSDVVTSINAGVDMVMIPYDYRTFLRTLKEAVEKGDIPMERIDDAVRRILTVKFQMGLFEHPFSDPQLLPDVGSEEHRALARQAVSESLVLLQNNNSALPIAKDTPTVFVAGQSADDIGIQCGGWTIEWQGQAGDITPGTTILEGIQASVSANTTVYYDRDGKFAEATDASGSPLIADVGIVVVGELPYAEGVGDNPNLALTQEEQELIQAVRERSKTLVVVLVSGRPMVITDQLKVSDAFVAAWLPGTEGQGVADVLFGDKPFTGRLPYTWPRTIEQIPFDFTNLPTEGCDAPLFPFGYGLDTSTQQTLTIPDCP